MFFEDLTPKWAVLLTGPPKCTYLCGTTPFDVLSVKIGSTVSAIASWRTHKRKMPVNIISRILGSETPDFSQIMYVGRPLRHSYSRKVRYKSVKPFLDGRVKFQVSSLNCVLVHSRSIY